MGCINIEESAQNQRFKCRRRCSDDRDLLRQGYSIDCINNDPNIHLNQFCPPCFQRAGRISDAKAKGVMYESSVTPFMWTSHSENSCYMCEMSSQQSVGEGPETRGKTVVTQGTTATHSQEAP